MLGIDEYRGPILRRIQRSMKSFLYLGMTGRLVVATDADHKGRNISDYHGYFYICRELNKADWYLFVV